MSYKLQAPVALSCVIEVPAAWGPQTWQIALSSRMAAFFIACTLRLRTMVSNSFKMSGTTHPPSSHIPEEMYHPWQTLFIHRNNLCGRLHRWDPVTRSIFSHILHSSFHFELGQPLWSVGRHLLRCLFPFLRMPTSPSYCPQHQTLTSPAAQWQQVAM
jgi:hypothetical protein